MNLSLTDEVVTACLRKVAYRGNLVRKVTSTFDIPRDPKNERYIDLCAAINADFLVTRDKDLLDLMSESTIMAKQFHQRFPGLTILDPVQFINEMRRTTPEAFEV
jgi:predicted nucleic acid-binding protein